MFEKSLDEKTSGKSNSIGKTGRRRKVAKEDIKNSPKNEKVEKNDVEYSAFHNKLKELGEGLKLDLSKRTLPSLGSINTPNLISGSGCPNSELNLGSFRMGLLDEGQGKEHSYYPSSSKSLCQT